MDVKCLSVGLVVKFLFVLSEFSQSWVVTTDVGDSPKYEISRKSLGVELLHRDRQGDMMKIIGAFGYCLFGRA